MFCTKTGKNTQLIIIMVNLLNIYLHVVSSEYLKSVLPFLTSTTLFKALFSLCTLMVLESCENTILYNQKLVRSAHMTRMVSPTTLFSRHLLQYSSSLMTFIQRQKKIKFRIQEDAIPQRRTTELCHWLSLTVRYRRKNQLPRHMTDKTPINVFLQ